MGGRCEPREIDDDAVTRRLIMSKFDAGRHENEWDAQGAGLGYC